MRAIDRRRNGLALLLLAVLGACDEPDAGPVDEPIRAIRPLILEAAEPVVIRRLPGTIAAAESTVLAFPISGTVQTVEVVLGDTVEAGMVLATLDDEPFALEVAAREAEVSQAEAALGERRQHVERQRELRAGGWVSEAALDAAEADFQAAEGRLDVAERRLELARRDRDDTLLLAPFAGNIAMRTVEPHQEIAAGEPVLELQDTGRLEVDVLMPETLIGRITRGAPVTIDVPPLDIAGLDGRVVEIGARAAAANAFPVTLSLDEPRGLWPGMTAEVIFRFETAPEQPTYLVPPAAVVALEDSEQDDAGLWTGMAVFRFDAETSTVGLTPVLVSAVHETQVEITGDLEPGDIIAGAGVEFLRDGQEVTLAEPGVVGE